MAPTPLLWTPSSCPTHLSPQCSPLLSTPESGQIHQQPLSPITAPTHSCYTSHGKHVTIFASPCVISWSCSTHNLHLLHTWPVPAPHMNCTCSTHDLQLLYTWAVPRMICICSQIYQHLLPTWPAPAPNATYLLPKSEAPAPNIIFLLPKSTAPAPSITFLLLQISSSCSHGITAPTPPLHSSPSLARVSLNSLPIVFACCVYRQRETR